MNATSENELKGVSMKRGCARRWFSMKRRWSLVLASALVALTDVIAHGAVQSLKPGDIRVPAHLGTIEKSAKGSGGPLVILIGEDHISFEVQTAVAHLLRYLQGAYDLTLVCTEGFDKPLQASGNVTIESVRRVAEADFRGRKISAVEYFARSNPQVAVIGVEDMAAYAAHGKDLDDGPLRSEAEQWSTDFTEFLKNDLGSVRGTQAQGERIAGALDKALNENDFAPFTAAVEDVTGKDSAVTKRLRALDQRREALLQKSKREPGDSAQMLARDVAMRDQTLQLMQKRNVKAAILVVGKLHLDGIGRLLGEKGASYVTIVPAGFGSNVKDEDHELYEKWRAAKPEGLEQWLANFKPQPVSARATARNRDALLAVLVMVDRLGREGMPEAEMLTLMQRSAPPGVTVDRVFATAEGHGVEFTANGKRAYAYFGRRAESVKATGVEAIEHGGGDGFAYSVYDGAGSGKPPIPPVDRPRGPEPPDGFRRRFLAVIPDQKKNHPERATIVYTMRDDRILRAVDDEKPQPLDVSHTEVRERVRLYQNAQLGPDKIFAAQRLSDALLSGLNPQLPAGRTELVQIFEGDVLDDVSLPIVQAIAGNADADHLKSVDPTRVYTLRWNDTDKGIDRLKEKLPEEERASKTEAVESVRKEANGRQLKKFWFSKEGRTRSPRRRRPSTRWPFAGAAHDVTDRIHDSSSRPLRNERPARYVTGTSRPE